MQPRVTRKLDADCPLYLKKKAKSRERTTEGHNNKKENYALKKQKSKKITDDVLGELGKCLV